MASFPPLLNFLLRKQQVLAKRISIFSTSLALLDPFLGVSSHGPSHFLPLEAVGKTASKDSSRCKISAVRGGGTLHP